MAATALMSAISMPAWAAGKRIGFASREIIADYNRGIIADTCKVIEVAGDTMVVVDGQGDPRKHNENIENLVNSHGRSPLSSSDIITPDITRASTISRPPTSILDAPSASSSNAKGSNARPSPAAACSIACRPHNITNR